MRKLIVQMNGATLDWDNDMVSFCIDNLSNVDTILLGRKTAEDFIPYWKSVAEKSDPNDQNTELGRPLTDIPKVIFSNKLKTNSWENTTIVNGDLAEEINKLKKKKGNDIIVYGGFSFVASLFHNELIDEVYLLVNPIVGSGEQITGYFEDNSNLILVGCRAFSCGSVMLHYQMKL